MVDRFKEKGIWIDKVYYSPYHKEEGIGKYKQDSPLRKPNPGMLLKAREEYGVDLHRSVMIGDHETDMQAANQGEIPVKILVHGDRPKPSDTLADVVVKDVREALNWVKTREEL